MTDRYELIVDMTLARVGQITKRYDSLLDAIAEGAEYVEHHHAKEARVWDENEQNIVWRRSSVP